VSVPPASILGKHLVNDASLTLGELIVLFYLLISIAHLHACVQNGKVSSHSNSKTHIIITWTCGTSVPSSQNFVNESSLSYDESFLFIQHLAYIPHYGLAHSMSEQGNGDYKTHI
jgi:hypothetical protein